MGGLERPPNPPTFGTSRQSRDAPLTPRRSERPGKAVTLLYPPGRSERPGKAVALLYPPGRSERPGRAVGVPLIRNVRNAPAGAVGVPLIPHGSERRGVAWRSFTSWSALWWHRSASRSRFHRALVLDALPACRRGEALVRAVAET